MFEKVRKKLSNRLTKAIPVGVSRNAGYISNFNNYRVPNAYTFYKGLSYDNTYPAIKAISNEFMTIRPYAIGADGQPVKKCNVIDRLYHPNKQMSSADFREALAVMTLVHRKTYLLVWSYEDGKAVPGGEITEDNIAGFTFLEGVVESTIAGVKYYDCSVGKFSENEVIEIYSGIDPYNLSLGYSPSVATGKWSNLDDYIAAYEAGLFENNAVPEGQFVITAASAEEFEKIVESMQKHHRGSGKNNNVQYVHRPISPATGNPVAPQIEWIPFGVTNKDAQLDVIFRQANDKIDSAFGVPASIRGVNDNNTYASVRVDEQIFIRYAVKPFATRIYSRLTHELNRITGGLGYALTFDIDIPGVADEEKVEAERKKVEFELINQAVLSGYSLDSIINAFDLPEDYKLLKEGYQKPIMDEDNPEVDEGNEAEDAPDSSSLKQVEVRKHDSHGSGECTCGKHKDYTPTTQEKKLIEEVAVILREQMEAQIEKAIEGNELNKDVNDADEDDINEMVAKVLAVLTAYMLLRGKVTYAEGIKLLKANNIAIDATTDFVVSSATKASYRAYLTNVANSYTADTATQIRNILAQGQTVGWNKEEIATRLREIMNTDEWRVQRIAQTEERRSYGQAKVDSYVQLMNETGAKIYKVWYTNSGAPCEFCQAMNGKRVLVSKPFLLNGESVSGADGGLFVNNFVDCKDSTLHPHCHCEFKIEVEKSTGVEVTIE